MPLVNQLALQTLSLTCVGCGVPCGSRGAPPVCSECYVCSPAAWHYFMCRATFSIYSPSTKLYICGTGRCSIRLLTACDQFLYGRQSRYAAVCGRKLGRAGYAEACGVIQLEEYLVCYRCASAVFQYPAGCTRSVGIHALAVL